MSDDGRSGRSEKKVKKTPHILIKTDGIRKTKVFVDGKELEDVTGVRFSQSYKENGGLPMLQIDMKATNVTLDAKMLPALPEPFCNHYISFNRILESERLSNDEITKLLQGAGIKIN